METISKAPVKLTAMHAAHWALGAEFVYRDGWKLPSHYTSIDEEAFRGRGVGGVFDVSPIGKLSFQGAGVLTALSRVLGLPEAITVGKAVKCPSPTASEDSRESVTVAGLTYDEALVLTSPGSKESIAEALEDSLSGCEYMVDLTSSWAGIGVVGPRGPEAMARVVDLDLDPERFTDGSCAQVKAAEVHCLVIRGDVSGNLAYQIYVTRDYGEYMWNALLHGGRGVGVSAIGIEAFERISGDSPGIPW